MTTYGRITKILYLLSGMPDRKYRKKMLKIV